MRVGLLIYGSLDTVSGGYLYDRKLVEHMRASGDTVEIISLPWRNYARHLSDNLSGSLSRRLRDARLDVLVQDELNHPSLFWLNRRLRPALPYPLIGLVHHLRCDESHPRGLNALYRRVEASYLRTLDGFICNSAATHASVAALSGTAKPYVIAHPAGDRFQPSIGEADIRRRALETGPLRILFVGNLVPRKGLHTLLAALAQLSEVDWQLTVVGNPAIDSGYAAEIKAQWQAMPIRGRIDFLGSIDDKALIREYGRGHVLAVPSSHEGFGIVYLEGMGFGLPAIATTSGGAGEIVRSGENGFLIPPGDSVALAAHLRQLAADRQSLARMGIAAQRSFAAHPTWAQTHEQNRRFLSDIRH